MGGGERVQHNHPTAAPFFFIIIVLLNPILAALEEEVSAGFDDALDTARTC
jgi:hypothetical protein